MKQLLKVGGWAGVILPVSILSNTGIHSKAREIIFKYFKVKSIVELGSNTFMATGTNTVILFLERRADSDYREIENAIDNFFDNKKDVTVSGIEHAFSKYVANAYDELAFEDYMQIISGQEVEHELYNDYKRAYGNDLAKIKEVEEEKLLYFILTYNQEVVIVKTGKKQEEKKFLGYRFSKTRGHEGLHWLPNGSKLYNDNDLLDNTKVNSYIYNAFKGVRTDIDKSLAKNMYYGRMNNYFEYGTNKFDKIVNFNKANKQVVISKYPIKKLGEVCEIKIGGTPSRYNPEYFEGDNLWVAIAEMNGQVITDTKEKITDEAVRESNVKLIEKGTTLLSFKLSIGKIAIAGANLYTNEAIAALIPWNKDEICDEYLFHLFDGKLIDLNVVGGKAFGKSLNQTNLKEDIKIPLPPLDIQKKIVAEISKVDEGYRTTRMTIETYRSKIENIFDDMEIVGKSRGAKPLRLLTQTNPSKSELSTYQADMLVSFVEMASISNNGFIENMVDRKLSDVRNGSYTYFKEDDIIIAKITPCMENGKCAIATGLTNGVGMGSSEFHIIRCNNEINNKYLFSYLNRHVVRDEAQQNMTGASGHRRVPIIFYEEMQIPLPTMDKQKEIVAEIEQYEKAIAEAQNKLSELEQSKKDILKKYLI